MNREKAETFVSTALADLEKCQTDAEIIAWDDANTSNVTYLELPIDLIKKLEAAYDTKVRWVVGAGGG